MPVRTKGSGSATCCIDALACMHTSATPQLAIPFSRALYTAHERLGDQAQPRGGALLAGGEQAAPSAKRWSSRFRLVASEELWRGLPLRLANHEEQQCADALSRPSSWLVVRVCGCPVPCRLVLGSFATGLQTAPRSETCRRSTTGSP
jgi:hypothetical protein